MSDSIIKPFVGGPWKKNPCPPFMQNAKFIRFKEGDTAHTAHTYRLIEPLDFYLHMGGDYVKWAFHFQDEKTFTMTSPSQASFKEVADFMVTHTSGAPDTRANPIAITVTTEDGSAIKITIPQAAFTSEVN